MPADLSKFEPRAPRTELCDGKILTIAVPAYNAAKFCRVLWAHLWI